MALRLAVTRSLGALVAAAALGAAVVPVASAASPSPSAPPKLPAGLYGASDPTYDGVWRQATALLALDAVKTAPPAAAVDWLTGQQCADGGFTAYRADTAQPCAAKNEDTNSTGLAVQALAALGGHQAAVAKAVTWLKGMQDSDGGWGYQQGAATDADSTAVVEGALTAAGQQPAQITKDGRNGMDALRGLQLGCDAPQAQRGAFAYQPDPKGGKLTANDKATTDGVIGAHGSGYLIAAPAADSAPKAPACPSGSSAKPGDANASAQAGSAYLAGVLDAGGQHLTTAQPGSTTRTPDYSTTADAVLALACDGHLAAARKPYDWLVANASGWAKDNPAALGQLVLASAAVGANPHDFGGTDLVRQLAGTGPRGSAAPAPSASSDNSTGKGGGESVWWVVGVGLVAGVGIGFALSLRRKRG
ncbi:prenyltransferase/squalene oxidase repeat-containing protein [Streptomyces sp. ICBB 8177]|uniref:prenyltransferase/squalene oxidase repeat-containing protein n=1 Tax=Streptomyces sp. ICBB 8177 TaxID=563922 RepID=UPI000D67FEF4|nr:prenyltransferase/squalene oxidase repeat-containing protein [Streptomyces sp. ICBB 8177]PWI43229.1 hypothetical protein CK485_13710 [Streptomyces sp. ICBB 8177]